MDLKTEIVTTIEDYYIVQDDADVHIDQELQALEDRREFMNEEDYEDEEHKLIQGQNQASNQASYLYSCLEDLFIKWKEETREKVNIESFEHLLR